MITFKLTDVFEIHVHIFKLHVQFKKNKPVDIGESRQRYHKKLSNMLLHVPNHALKDMYILNYGTFQKIVFIIVPSRCNRLY